MGKLLVAYSADWENEYRQLSERLGSALGGLITGMHHVGSTSIPGMVAKPIIDIDVVISDYGVIDAVSRRLAMLGYTNEGERGIPDRIAFARADSRVPHGEPELEWMAHHLYVCPAFSRELQRHLAFRDHLRVSSEARAEYGRIKLLIEQETNGDKQAYAELKEVRAREFVEGVLASHGKAHG
jgi:GrpB-like predicted nucleotidyltransferase (UPF0157 family)